MKLKIRNVYITRATKVAKALAMIFLALVLLHFQQTFAFEQENIARGGNTPSAEWLIAQYQEALTKQDSNEIKRAKERIIYYAGQLRRAEDERLSLFLTLTREALKDDDLGEYQALIAEAKKFRVEFGHYLNLHHFYTKSNEIKSSIVESMVWLAKNDSDLIQDVHVRFIWRIYNYVNALDQAKTFELLESLYQYGFPKSYTPVSMDEMYLKLIRFYLEQSELQKAKAVFHRTIHDVLVYMEIWHDRRFQKLWPLIEEAGAFDPIAIIEKDLKTANEFLQSDEEISWSQWIDTVTRMVILNRSLGRYQQATDLALDSIKQVPAEIQKQDSFFWLQNELANVYSDSGQADKAFAIYEELLKVELKEMPILINGYIDYALTLFDNRQYAKAEIIAQKVVKDYQDYTSEFGRYYAQSVLACVWQKSGKTKQAKQLLATMNQNASINYYATTFAALCLKDEKIAEALLVVRLNDPDNRAETLSFLSHYSDSHGAGANRALIAFRDSVIEGRKLHLLITKYGRTKHWFLPAAYWEQI